MSADEVAARHAEIRARWEADRDEWEAHRARWLMAARAGGWSGAAAHRQRLELDAAMRRAAGAAHDMGELLAAVRGQCAPEGDAA